MWETLAIAAVSFLLWWWWKSSNEDNKVPPGPRRWPVLGNLLQLATPIPIQRKLHTLAARYGPVMYLRTGTVPVIIISSGSVAKDFFKYYDAVFADRLIIQFGRIMCYGCKDVGLSPYGDHWRQARKLLVSELLRFKQMGYLSEFRELEADLMVHHIDNTKEDVLDVGRMISTFTFNIILLLMFGNKPDEQLLLPKNMTFLNLVNHIGNTSGSLANVIDYIPWLSWLQHFLPVTYKMKTLHQIYNRFMDSVLLHREQNHKGSKQRDFVGALLDKSSHLEPDHIKAFALDMLMAGTQISTTAEWVMSLLLKNQLTLEKAQEEVDRVVGGSEKRVTEQHLSELKYLKCILKETLRLYPTLPLVGPHMSMELMEDTQLFGYNMPKGTVVFVNAWALGRDNKVWRDADKFIPERFMGEENIDITGLKDEEVKMMPFSSGRRGCPGAPLAIPCVLMAVATLIRCFNWRIHGDIDMTERFGPGISRKSRLLASPTPRDC